MAKTLGLWASFRGRDPEENRSEARTSNASGISISGKLSAPNQLSHTF